LDRSSKVRYLGFDLNGCRIIKTVDLLRTKSFHFLGSNRSIHVTFTDQPWSHENSLKTKPRSQGSYWSCPISRIAYVYGIPRITNRFSGIHFYNNRERTTLKAWKSTLTLKLVKQERKHQLFPKRIKKIEVRLFERKEGAAKHFRE